MGLGWEWVAVRWRCVNISSEERLLPPPPSLTTQAMRPVLPTIPLNPTLFLLLSSQLTFDFLPKKWFSSKIPLLYPKLQSYKYYLTFNIFHFSDLVSPVGSPVSDQRWNVVSGEPPPHAVVTGCPPPHSLMADAELRPESRGPGGAQ